MAGLLSVALTGINASQAGLTTASHNIANANVTGYNRQQIVQGTQDPMFSGSGFYGQGTRVDTVKRVYSQFLDNQVLNATASKAQYETYSTQITQLDNLLGDSSTGVSASLSSFFAAVDQVSSSPSNISARQALIASGESLASRFQSTYQRIEEIRADTDGQIAASADAITSYAKQIADLNQKIITAQSAGPTVPANDMLDERDQVVAKLNQEIKATTQLQDDGSINVFIGTGQPLVVGNNYFELKTGTSTTDPTRASVLLGMPGGANVQLAESLLTGGRMGGLLTFRSEALDAAENALGRIAVGVSETFNAQHQLGQDLDGVLGGKFFNTIAPNSLGLGSATGSLSATVADVNKLTADDYVVTVSGGAATVTRYSDGSSVTPTVAGSIVSFDGISIDLSVGSPSGSFLVQPTRVGAQKFSVAISDPRAVAAASPLTTSAPSTNTGKGVISAGAMTTIASPSFTGSTTITYNGGALSVSGGTLSPLSYDVTNTNDTSGKTFTWTSAAGDVFEFKISGVPSDHDTFVISPNSSGISDNRNALALGKLQITKTLDGSTYATAYAQMVSDIGIKANSAEVNMTAQDALLTQATTAQQSMSGVNLDEEAANLIRYQQAYQASARVLNVAKSLFDDILSIMR